MSVKNEVGRTDTLYCYRKPNGPGPRRGRFAEKTTVSPIPDSRPRQTGALPLEPERSVATGLICPQVHDD
jgi:hypothetical protein